MKYCQQAISIICSVATLSLAACSSETGDGDQASGANLEQNDGWALTTSIDKFTDQQIRVASKRFVVGSANIDTEISCNNGRSQYKFTAFGQEDVGLPFRWNTGSNFYGNIVTSTSMRVRLDNLEAFSASVGLSKYNNQIEFSSGENGFAPRSINLLAPDASRILLALQLEDREVELEIDQTIPNVAAALQECRTQISASDDQSGQRNGSDWVPEKDDIAPTAGTSSTESSGEEFGGAKPGMNYPEFRSRLIKAGLKPVNPDGRSQLCNSEPDSYDCTYKYKETDSCSGSGEGFCNYLWSRGSDSFTVLTREGEGGQVVEMSFNR